MRQAHPDYELICADFLTYAGNPETLKEIVKDIRFYKIDISDKEGVFKLFEDQRPDAVVNFAAESHVDRSIYQPELF
jgi:dTDP-D-glucose 4,6-dehydratase